MIWIVAVHTYSVIGELDKDTLIAYYMPRYCYFSVFVQGLSLLISRPGGKRCEIIKKSHKTMKCPEFKIFFSL